MAWGGYFEFAGVEIANASRTERYANAMPSFTGIYNNPYLGPMLNETYSSPLQDLAPWTDEDFEESFGFYGFYPLDVTGIEDATVTAPLTESLLDGAVVGKVRRGSRTMVVNGLLLGESECSVEYGLRWLRAALSGGHCPGRNPSDCGGDTLCYLSCEPCLWMLDEDGLPCGPTEHAECYSLYERHVTHVTVTNGPAVSAKWPVANGYEVWNIQWTMVAANPYEFGYDRPLIEGFLDPLVTNPYVNWPDDADIPDMDTIGTMVPSDHDCSQPAYMPISDPDCPAFVPPPPVPGISVSCFTMPASYRRRMFTIPKEWIPLWGDSVPTFQIQARRADVRQLRIRFYANPYPASDVFETDPCAYCGDIVFSYVPQGSTLLFDGADRTVYVEDNVSGKRRADSLVWKSDGTPFEWPELTCGFAYIVTVETPNTLVPPVIDMSLTPRIA